MLRRPARCAVACAVAFDVWTAAAASPGRLAPDLEARLERELPGDGLDVIVLLRGEVSQPAGAARRARVAAEQQRALDALPAGEFELRRRHASLPALALRARRGAIDALSRHPDVELVYLDGVLHPALAQGRALVGGTLATSHGFDGAGVRVAVLDTGVDTDHPDLASDVVVQQCFCDSHPSPAIGCCPNGGPTQSGPGAAEDGDGHGTTVAGVITSDGVVAPVGVAPAAEIVAVRVFPSGGIGASLSDVDAALDWLLTNLGSLGVRAVNLSLGDGGEYASGAVFPCSTSATAVGIRDLVAAGVLVFAASGNEGHDAGVSFPACVTEAISVGGVYDAAFAKVAWCADAGCTQTLCTDTAPQADTFVCHTNSGANLDVVAPDYRTRTTAVGGGYVVLGGTSIASPFAAGMAALLLQADPGLEPGEVESLLKSSGPRVPSPDNGLAFPRPDVAAALTEVIGGSDVDGDGAWADGDGSDAPGDAPCAPGATLLCDDSCPADANPDQADADADGVGDACDVACANRLDDDGDALVDAATDPGCADAVDGAETDAALVCDDGLDNDGDGAGDLADPGCRDGLSSSESPDCDDDLDNDGDGGIDWDGGAGGGAPDTLCVDRPWAIRERSSSCGLGFELVLLAPLLRRRRRSAG
jgi:subtilisin family serine protease